MKIKDNFVSVVIPVFNSEEFIERTLLSILDQDFPDFEIIVINDASTDSTSLILNDLCFLYPKINVFNLKVNVGIGHARNIGQVKSCGEYIAFCDSDDIWEPHKLSSQIEFLCKNKTYFTCSAYNYIDTSHKIISKFYPKELIDYFSLLKTCDIGTSTVIYNRKYLGVLLMPNLRMKQDYLTWLNLLKDINYINSIPFVLASIRKHSKSNSFSKIKAFKFQFIALGFHLNCSFFNLKRLYYFFNYVYFGIRKHY